MSKVPLPATTAEASSGRCDTDRRVPNSDEGVSLGLGRRITRLPRIRIYQASDAALSAIPRPS